MNIVQCTFCKRPFHTLGGKICTNCHKKIDEQFIIVRDYIYDNKDTDIDRVSEETKVSKQVIMHLLKEGRLILGDEHGDGGGVLFCESCKKSINTGRLCKDCKGKIASTIDKSITTSKPSQTQSSDPSHHFASAKISK